MPFPSHDHFWTDAEDFIRERVPGASSLMAPDEFVERFEDVYCYEAPSLDPDLRVDWLVVHKGLFRKIPRSFLDRWTAVARPVFANEVFVVFSQDHRLPDLSRKDPHVAALFNLLQEPSTSQAAANPRLRPVRFASLDVEGVRAVMNERFRRDANDAFAGYEHPHRWDQARFHEVDRLTAKLLGSVKGLDVLEIGCGMGRNTRFLLDARSYLGTDLSDVAIQKARNLHGETAQRRYARMDAMQLELPDSSVDLVLGVEIIEHVQHADKLLGEVGRVLKPQGRFLFNSANRDSLHLRMVRKLGLPEFRGTVEHFREFGYQEMLGILKLHGLEAEASEGVFLRPYIAVPGVDARIQDLSQDDPELVEIFRVLGERAGPDFGFEFMILARKR